MLARPIEMINKSQATGEIEVLVEDFEVLNKSKTTIPFNIREFQKGKEALRMQYRYLDMRFAEMQRNLRVRSRVMMDIRNFLTSQAGFVEVETPTLFKATPGVRLCIFHKTMGRKLECREINCFVCVGSTRICGSNSFSWTFLFVGAESATIQTDVDGWWCR